MTNDSPDGLFGKHELGMVAIAIVKACERAGTWDICFRVPPDAIGDDRKRPMASWHLGFTHLIHRGYLNPVPCLGACWSVGQAFVDYMNGRHELPETLAPGHSIAGPERSTFYPPVGRLA